MACRTLWEQISAKMIKQGAYAAARWTGEEPYMRCKMVGKTQGPLRCWCGKTRGRMDHIIDHRMEEMIERGRGVTMADMGKPLWLGHHKKPGKNMENPGVKAICERNGSVTGLVRGAAGV